MLTGLVIAMFWTPWLVFSIAQWIPARSLAWQPHRALPGIVRCYLWSMTILGLATKLSYLEEKHWVAKDRLGAPEGLFSTKMKALTFDAVKKESEALLGPRP